MSDDADATLAPPSERRGCVQFNVTMPVAYAARLKRRCNTSGSSRSEELRKAIDASEPGQSLAVDASARKILAAAMALRRLVGASGAAAGFLNTIEDAAGGLMSGR